MRSLWPYATLFLFGLCSLLRKRMEAVRDPNPDKRYDEDSLRNCVILVEYSDMVLPHLDVIRQGLWVDKGKRNKN